MKVYQLVAMAEFSHVVSRSVFRTADEANGYLSNFRKLVTEVGKALVRAGYKGYRIGPGPVFGPADRRGVQWFQTQHSELAGDADGHFGPLTWKMLKVAVPK